MADLQELEQRIRDAFATAPYPGDGNLRGSDESDEPFLLEAEFRGKRDWAELDAEFLDRAPDGFSTALCFYDGYRKAQLPANLLQAQRDYFGSHTYERSDRAGWHHTEWPRSPER